MSLSRRKKSQNFLPLIEKKKKKNTRENILTKKTLLYFILSENGIEPQPSRNESLRNSNFFFFFLFHRFAQPFFFFLYISMTAYVMWSLQTDFVANAHVHLHAR